MSYQDWVKKIIAVIRLFFIQSRWKGTYFKCRKMFKPLMEHTIVNKGVVFYLFIIFIHRVKVKSLESNTSYWPWNQGNMKITISIVCYAVFSSFNTKSEEVSEAWSTPDKLEELYLEKFWQIQWRRPYQGYFFSNCLKFLVQSYRRNVYIVAC